MNKSFTMLLTALMLIGVYACSADAELEQQQTEQNVLPAVQARSAAIDHTLNYEYTTTELWSERDGLRIYGIVYRPLGIEGRMPAVIFSHGFGGSHNTGAQYARRLAERGYVVYCFDFCGATSSSRSDGATTDMSIFTEESDLKAVVATMKAQDYVDGLQLYLMGTSQGGMVSAMAAAEMPYDIRAAILLYPALCIADNTKEWFGSKDGIPDTYNLWGVTLGRAYFERLFDFDTYGYISRYMGPVLIVHGDEDGIVPVSYAERAAETYANAELHILPGAGHGFYGSDFEQTVTWMLDFLASHAGNETQPSTDLLDTEILPIPADYQQASQRGSVVRLDYTATSYATGQTTGRYAYVYLPYGYDTDTQRRYNVLYLMHGGGGSEETYFGGAGQESTLKRVADNMIERGDIRPCIIVTPSFYLPDDGNTSVSNSAEAVREFPGELVNSLMPAVESTYRTYALNTTTDGLRQSRRHRAFSGFSMGSVCTWHVFCNALAYFHDFVPLSGDCWAIATQGGRSHPEETAQYLADAITRQGMTPRDFYLHIMTGSDDIAEPMLTAQTNAMRQLPQFTFSPDKQTGNAYYGVLDGGVHTFSYDLQYIYNALRNLWKNQQEEDNTTGIRPVTM